jgi:hypothetical protein
MTNRRVPGSHGAGLVVIINDIKHCTIIASIGGTMDPVEHYVVNEIKDAIPAY